MFIPTMSTPTSGMSMSSRVKSKSIGAMASMSFIGSENVSIMSSMMFWMTTSRLSTPAHPLRSARRRVAFMRLSSGWGQPAGSSSSPSGMASSPWSSCSRWRRPIKSTRGMYSGKLRGISVSKMSR